VNNASDWYIYNPDAVIETQGFPECPRCDPDAGDECAVYSNASIDLLVGGPLTSFAQVSSHALDALCHGKLDYLASLVSHPCLYCCS